jgi:hypothetical protein
MYCAVLFHSTSSALRLDKLCRAEGLDVKLIPVPRHLSSDCGVCMRFPAGISEQVDSIIESNRVSIQEIKDI